jgi:hypothetical protein
MADAGEKCFPRNRSSPIRTDSSVIIRRHVFYVAGYEPADPALQLARFRRSLSVFAATWCVRSWAGDLHAAADGTHAWWEATTSAANWQVRTTYELLRWDDIIREIAARPTPMRLAQAALALADFVLTGTLFRYFRANWQYACFFLYPFAAVGLFAAVAAASGRAISSVIAPNPVATPLSVAAGLGIFAGLMLGLGGRWWIAQLLDHWIFARELVNGARPDTEARLDAFAARIAACVRSGAHEVLVVGHSLGTVLALEAVARALARDPELARRGPAVGLLTVGSTIAALALHPKGTNVRHAARVIAGEPSLLWTEYQTREDAISFYRIDPVTLVRIPLWARPGAPRIIRTQVHDLMPRRTFNRNRLNFMRLHCQFVMANEIRAGYDYFMIICGPLPLGQIANKYGALRALAADGSLIGLDTSRLSGSSASR